MALTSDSYRSNASLSTKVLGLLIILGAFLRYLRTFPSLEAVNFLPYLIEAGMFYWFLCIFMINRTRITPIDFSIAGILLALLTSFCLNAVKSGVTTQLLFLVQYILPISVYFFVRFNPGISVKSFDKILIYFTLAAFILIVIEFTTLHLFKIQFFNFVDYFKRAGESVRWSSAIQYFLLGRLSRPWGFMALPQSTGATFSALAVYFAVNHRQRKTLPYLIVSLVGLYLSGSRTGIIVFFAGLFLLFLFKRDDKRRFFFIGGLLFVFLLTAPFFIYLYTPEVVFYRFLNSFKSYFMYITFSPDTYDMSSVTGHLSSAPDISIPAVIWGQGGEFLDNPLAGAGEIHILNIFLRIGLVSSVCFITIILFISGFSWKFSLERPCGWDYYAPSFYLFMCFIFGSLHYDILSRYPVSVISYTALAFLSKYLDFKNTKRVEC